MERLIVWHRWCPPPEPTPEAVAQAAIWRIGARGRFLREGAELIAEVGGSAVFSLDPADTVRAVELCLSINDEVEKEGAEYGQVTHALAVGVLERPHAQGAHVGDALDRAQALANRARPSEIVLDPAAQGAAAAVFLFSRALSAGPAVQGEVIDRAHPRRRDCRSGLAHLNGPQLHGAAQAQLGMLRQVAQSAGRHRVVLVGAYGSGTGSWLRHVAHEVKPALWLDVRALSTALAPLSGLSYALRRLPANEAPEALFDLQAETDRAALAVLVDIRRGEAVARRDAVNAVQKLLARALKRSQQRGWLTVSPAPLVDPATIGVVSEVGRDGGPDCFTLLRVPPDARPPESFARGGNLAEIRVPPMTQSEGRALAQSMLGKLTSQDIARRAAAMGGNTPLGVAEAVRVLIATGDVIADGGKFRWRRGPAGRVATLTIEGLLEERVDEVSYDARRLLEALATVPDPDESELVAAVADADGLSQGARELALEELVGQALVDRNERGLSLSRYVRSVVEQAMPPARLAELSRFVAEGLERQAPGEDAYARATLAHYVARGGKPSEAANMLLAVALSAGQLGFVRSGVRLAAAAVECEPSEEVRARAAAIAEKLSERSGQAPPRRLPSERPQAFSESAAPTGTRPLADKAMAQAVDAIMHRDFDGVDRALELVVAAGRDGPPVDRLRGLVQLAQGDSDSAQRLLLRARMREHEEQGSESTRTAIATAILLAETGQASGGVREALRALQIARATKDGPGEQAALRTLALCFERLGRTDDAAALRAIPSRSTLPDAAPSSSSSE
jgi:hypothetical protein